jgi:hypothetical protein
MDGILTLYDVSVHRTYTQENESIAPVTTDRKTTIQEI